MDPLLKETVIWLNKTLLDGKFVKGLRVYLFSGHLSVAVGLLHTVTG